MTDDAHRFTPIEIVSAQYALPLHEGKTFHQYTDQWKARPRYAIRFTDMKDKPGWSRASTHYRLAFREISRSTDERTMIAAIIPPGYVFGHKGTCERTPWLRPDAEALILCAVFNSFAFDWCVRRKIAASVSLFMLNSCPLPELSERAAQFLAHGALRLSCRHALYDRLWQSQLPPACSPPQNALSDDGRATLRAAVDAVVAKAFELSRDDYHHVLGGFSHKADAAVPGLCRAAFDALTEDENAFYRRYDHYGDVPRVASLSQPASDIATASATLMPSMAAERIPPA